MWSQGYWEDDDRCGDGELTYNTGEAYKGQWRDDKQSKLKNIFHYISRFGSTLLHNNFGNNK